MAEQNRLTDFSERYLAGEIPWDDELPPPELIELAKELVPGKALDLGCGYGRSAIFLAQKGWQVVGVDFVDLAVAEAKRRALIAGVSDRAQFYSSSVTDLAFLEDPFDLIVDIGCMHSMPEEELFHYHKGVVRLLKENGIYLLFAHLRDPQASDEESKRWIKDEALRELFSEGFSLQRADYGVTQVADKPPWSSAWFYFRRHNSQS